MNDKRTSKKLYSIVISYEKADVKTRSLFNVCKEKTATLLEEAKNREITGTLLINTCNRTELIGFVNHPYQLISLLCDHTEGSIETLLKVSTILEEKQVVKHLFRVAAGLESQILGDYEIAGQLRCALKIAREKNALGGYLERLGNTALQASKKVKNETQISYGTTSVSYVALQYLAEVIPNYQNKKILIYGLGKIGRHTCKNLLTYTKIKKITLINRTLEKAITFAEHNEKITAKPQSELNENITDTDILIVSTGAEKPTVITENIPPEKKILILDLSVPQNVVVDTSLRKGVTLINVDELSKTTSETLSKRTLEIPKAEAIIATYEAEFMQWSNSRNLTPTINAVKNALENIQNKEINFLSKKIENFDAEQAEIITSKVIQKITKQIITHLKADDTSVPQSIETLHKIFI